MIDHSINNNPDQDYKELPEEDNDETEYLHDSNTVALIHHVDETVPVTRPALQFVGHGLVPGPPLAALDVLIGRRHLDTTESLGTEDLDTLVSDGVPGPLEQVDDGLLLVLAV